MSAQRTFRLYIDESGNHQMGGKCERYLGLLGVIIPLDTYGSIFKPAMLRIKREYFSGDPDSPILFHREEVTQRKGPFAVLDNDSHREIQWGDARLLQNADVHAHRGSYRQGITP